MNRLAVAVISLIAALAVSLVAAYVVLARPAVTGAAPSAATADPTPTFSVTVRNADSLDPRSIRATVDGSAARGVERDGDRIVFTAPAELQDGRHEATLSATSSTFLAGSIEHSWTFNVDTKPPSARLSGLGNNELVSQKSVSLAASSETGASLTLTVGTEQYEQRAGSDGTATFEVELADGSWRGVLVAEDEAGNTSTARIDFRVDANKPVVGPRIKPTYASNTPQLQVGVRDATRLRLMATANGAPMDVNGTGPLRTITAREPLAEGRHLVKVNVRDEAGHVTVVERTILIDSTEQFGAHAMLRGARGADVRGLHEELRKRGYFGPNANPKEWRNQVYLAGTAEAVRRFQQDHGLEADGQVGDKTIRAMTQRIVIDQASHTLTLYQGDTVIKTYPVAVGSPEYPTPYGEFTIIDMQENPTWNPPDSDWAKDAKPIPPGPNNPLGTRWMGLDVSAVGIHGTPNPESLGYSVSHGCIRMAIPDVEELFELVDVGTPVIIQ